MNKARRAKLSEIMSKIEDLKYDLDLIVDEERDYLDNIPENLQGSERYERASDVVDTLESSVISLDEVIENIEEAMV